MLTRPMSEWVELYSGNETAAESLSVFLEGRAIDALKTVVQGQIISRSGAREALTRVDVRPETLESARVVYREWAAPQSARAEGLSRRLLGILLISTIPSLLWVGMHFVGVAAVPYPQLGWIAGVWFVSLIVVAQVEDRRQLCEDLPDGADASVGRPCARRAAGPPLCVPQLDDVFSLLFVDE